jgi:regulatory protein
VPDDLERCYIAALRILDFRFNSEAELRRKLAVKKFGKEDIEATIARLRDEKWLDDERFAAALVRTRSMKRIGRLRLQRELSAAGIDRETAERVLRENANPEREREALEALCRRKFAALERKHGAEFVRSGAGRAKLAGALARSGYDHAAITDVIDHLVR